ncbi:hypothetical protein GGX14DRAFT_570227 [Mycena pura]|uniref:Uncharacterized protein n=1 Tax=Mycena pura TaxID=153505 RepID=A0AAD6V7V9_9AGAR|nr:hypothetical protein GGX14DRAFT_570227 [Mycena pura]
METQYHPITYQKCADDGGDDAGGEDNGGAGGADACARVRVRACPRCARICPARALAHTPYTPCLSPPPRCARVRARAHARIRAAPYALSLLYLRPCMHTRPPAPLCMRRACARPHAVLAYARAPYVTCLRRSCARASERARPHPRVRAVPAPVYAPRRAPCAVPAPVYAVRAVPASRSVRAVPASVYAFAPAPALCARALWSHTRPPPRRARIRARARPHAHVGTVPAPRPRMPITEAPAVDARLPAPRPIWYNCPT